MRYLSLFTGAGGIDLGLDAAGWHCTGQCEIDATCRAVLERHWPCVPRWTDVRDVAHPDVDGRRRPVDGSDDQPGRDRDARHARTRGLHAGIDLIVGGFPCQDVSVAGRRAGLAGERSGLWWEFHRIAAAVRPTALLIENVEGLLSSNGGRDMGAILDALADLGYGVAWRVLDAQHFGVPQRRRRVFLLALPGGRPGAERAAQVLALTTSGAGDSPAGRGEGPGTPARVVGGPQGAFGDIADTLRSHPRPGSNSFGAIVSTLGTTMGGGRGLNAENAAGGQLVPVIAATLTSGGHSAGVNAPGRRKEDDHNLVPVVVGALTRGGPGKLDDNAIGGGQVIANALDRMAGGPDDNSAQANHLTPTTAGVRRLTPMECERLMGWPDDHTRWTHDGTEVADSRRYAMCGNGVVAPVAQWIGERLHAELAYQEAA